MSSVEAHTWSSFSEFLANAPPGSSYNRHDFFEDSRSGFFSITAPEITMHCKGKCDGMRPFDGESQQGTFGQSKGMVLDFLCYFCRTCRSDMVVFPVLLSMQTEWIMDGQIRKVGQWPSFGPTTPSRLLRLLRDDREYFLKGRRAEALGLGVGAYSYYRRVVENQRNSLIEAIIKVAKQSNAKTEVISTLERALTEKQFKKSVDDIRDAVPEVLKIQGYNPLTLLHNALSEGIHNQSDDDCLKLAQDIRTVLIAFSEKVSQALKDQQEIQEAVNRLANPQHRS